MKRRNFVQAAATAGAAAAASTLAAPAISQGLKQWKLAMSWPLNSPGLGTSGQRVAQRITQLSGGKISVKVYGGGELVPAFRRLRCRQRRRCRHVPFGRVLLAGQAQGLQLLYRGALRADRHRTRRLDEIRRRPGALGRAVGRVQPQGLPRRQHRHPDGRLVSQADREAGRFQGPEIPHAGHRRRSAAGSRRHRRQPAGGGDLSRRSHRAPSTPPNGSARGTTSPSVSTRSPSTTTIRASTSPAPPPAS